jgi:hypothetical protein
MAELFLVTKENIRQHIKNILEDNELSDSTTKNFLVPAQDGKVHNTKLYNLEMIISVGYITIEVLEMLDDIKVDIIIYTYPSATISKKVLI